MMDEEYNAKDARLAVIVVVVTAVLFFFVGRASACDKKEHLKIYERIDFIEQYLGIPMGEKEKINNNGTWFDPIKRKPIGSVGMHGAGIAKGRFDRLAGQLGYLWFVKGDSDWPTWNKVQDECIPENGCLDTTLGY